jgi:hypothetical protein
MLTRQSHKPDYENLADSPPNSLEDRQRRLDEARSAYILGKEGISDEKLKEYERRYETNYIAGTKSLISVRRHLLRSIGKSFRDTWSALVRHS